MSTPAPGPDPAPRSLGNAFIVLLGVGLVAVLGVSLWALLRPTQTTMKPNPVAAAHANVRGIALMEQFNYPEAIPEFEEAVRLAPDWLPAKINLGIALLNRGPQDSAAFDRALKLFKEILDKEPDNPYAHYCTGIIHFHFGRLDEARPHFDAVTRTDPTDAYAWYYRGRSRLDDSESEESHRDFEKALKLNPYHNAARYSVTHHAITAEDEKRKLQLLEDFRVLSLGGAHDLTRVRYTEMGRYAEVIGSSPAAPPEPGLLPMFEPVKAVPKLTDGSVWAADDKTDALRKAVRTRFGGAMLVLDYDRDQKPDVLLLGAVTRGGDVRDVLLRNSGNNTFADVTADVGLAAHLGSFGGAVGDFDNDGYADVVLAGPAGLKLLRNVEGKRFEDKTAAAGLDKESGVFLTAAWVDLDQDGDLDLVAAKYATTSELALKQLRSEKAEGEGRLAVFANTGEAPVLEVGKPVPPLSVAFQPLAKPEALLVKGPVVSIVTTDVDGDLDVDLLVLVDGQPPITLLNDRLLRFHTGDAVTSAGGQWGGGFVLDANGDDQPDIVIADPAGAPRVLVSKRDAAGGNLAERFGPGVVDSAALRSASWSDLDLDGRTDIVGVSAERKPVLLQGDGKGKFAKRATPFGPDADATTDLLALSVVDVDGDNNPDLLAWSAGAGLRVFKSAGNGNRGLRLALTGRREVPPPNYEGKPIRTNADAAGCWVRLHAGPLRTAAETTTFAAGLGQSRLPIHFGIGKADFAEVVRIRWPDWVIQAEVNQTAGLVAITELDRRPSSCPVLFTWDGERFVYVTDFLGAGAMGEELADGSTRPPRPEESVKIESSQLAMRNGKYVLKVAEPMDETMYLDRLRLDVIDHPADVSIFPDERFATSEPQPTQERLYFRDSERVFASKATDHRGRDVTATLRDRDGKHVEGFAKRAWLGYAEDHHVELDFNGALKDLPVGRRVYLVLAGWIDYPFPESIYAATQAGVPTIAPVLEQRQRDGSWKLLGEVGFPAGLTRVMTRDVTGWIDPEGGPVRLRTNLQIYWDQLFLAPVAEVEKGVRELEVSRASLEHRGFAQEYSPGGKPPVAYDYDRLEPVAVTRWKGKFTRTGDVTELLAATDDRHVVCGPGDEVTVEFGATGLPPLPVGWKRSFVLRSWGYCKDTAPTTMTAGQVGPLPYRAMPHYPYDPAKNPPPAAVVEYDRKWNTRPAGAR
jgi:tetratricopeptide (TPR) repeat protein